MNAKKDFENNLPVILGAHSWWGRPSILQKGSISDLRALSLFHTLFCGPLCSQSLTHLGHRPLAAFLPRGSLNSTCHLTCVSHSPSCDHRPCLDNEADVISCRGEREAGPSLSCLGSSRRYQGKACKIQHKALSVTHSKAPHPGLPETLPSCSALVRHSLQAGSALCESLIRSGFNEEKVRKVLGLGTCCLLAN